jgi:hypothetical protein
LCKSPYKSNRAATGVANNTAMRHILELTLRQPPLYLTQEATVVPYCVGCWN